MARGSDPSRRAFQVREDRTKTIALDSASYDHEDERQFEMSFAR
jgi:hypothetical protein